MLQTQCLCGFARSGGWTVLLVPKLAGDRYPTSRYLFNCGCISGQLCGQTHFWPLFSFSEPTEIRTVEGVSAVFDFRWCGYRLCSQSGRSTKWMESYSQNIRLWRPIQNRAENTSAVVRSSHAKQQSKSQRNYYNRIKGALSRFKQIFSIKIYLFYL